MTDIIDNATPVAETVAAPNGTEAVTETAPALTADEIAALRRDFPDFDPEREMAENPRFTRLISPDTGLTAEEAYYLTHRQEILASAILRAEREAAEKITNAILSGSRRPDEAGTRDRAPTPSAIDYRRAPKSAREELKRRIREAAARGEKIFPGR